MMFSKHPVRLSITHILVDSDFGTNLDVGEP